MKSPRKFVAQSKVYNESVPLLAEEGNKIARKKRRYRHATFYSRRPRAATR